MYMDVKIKLNGKLIIDSVDQDMVLLDFCRKHNCFSVKRGCESGNCGLCTVLLDGKPVHRERISAASVIQVIL